MAKGRNLENWTAPSFGPLRMLPLTSDYDSTLRFVFVRDPYGLHVHRL